MNELIRARDAFAARHPERAVHLGGRRWGVTDLHAPGPVLLLLPGTLGRGDVFWRVMELLKGRARMVAVTYPATHDLAQWAADLLRLLNRLEIAQATVLGSSLGGYLAQWLAGAAPDRCSGLIAANTLASAAEVAARPPYAGDLAATPMAQLRAGFAAGLGAWAETHPDQHDLVALLLAEVAGRIPARHLRARLMALKHAPELPELPLPPERVAVIDAGDDPLIPPEMREAVRARLAPGTTFRFRHGGHFPYVTRPALYAAALEESLGLPEPRAADWGSGAMRQK